jgi:hypothetical protein
MAECACCDPNAPKATLLNVGNSIIGVLGLKEIMQEVSQLGVSDRGKLKLELMSRFRKRNYLPGGAEAEYENALLQEYLKHISR